MPKKIILILLLNLSFAFIGISQDSRMDSGGINSQQVSMEASDETELVLDNTESELSTTGCDSLRTTFVGGNGHNGNMFDVTAFAALKIKKFTVSPQDTTKYAFYYYTGTYSGLENYPAAWLHYYTSALVSPHANGVTITLPSQILIPAGATFAFYITTTNVNVNSNYTNDLVNTYAATNADMAISVGCGLKFPFCDGGTPYPHRKWNGKIHYCLVPVGVDEENLISIEASLFPNPFENSATLQINSPSPDTYSIFIYNILGNVLRTQQNITTNEIKIEKGNLSPGIYFYRLSGKKGATANGKFIIE